VITGIARTFCSWFSEHDSTVEIEMRLFCVDTCDDG